MNSFLRVLRVGPCDPKDFESALRLESEGYVELAKRENMQECNGGYLDMFVTKVNPSGERLAQELSIEIAAN